MVVTGVDSRERERRGGERKRVKEKEREGGVGERKREGKKYGTHDNTLILSNSVQTFIPREYNVISTNLYDLN